MSKNGFITSLRTPGISRNLTVAFLAVIVAAAGISVPVTLYSFKNISDKSDRAWKSSVTLENVSHFQRRMGDVRTSARDLANRDNKTVRTNFTNRLQKALDAASCIGNADKCERADLKPGGQVPEDEALQWATIAARAAVAKEEFQTAIDGDRRAAVRELDRALAEEVELPSQQLAQAIAQRGLTSQEAINQQIVKSSSLLVMSTIISIVIAVLLAMFVPRHLMRRLEHLRFVSHRLAQGDLGARADEQYAVRNDEIGDLISDFNLMAMAMQRQTLELRTVQEQLHIALEQEQERATRDPLTGLRNHRYFQDSLSAELERCRRSGGQVSIAMLDLDDFKQVNDRFGHSEGDAVLRRATKCISDNLRPYDLACRLGGEEFGIIFPEATADEAKAVLDRIAQHLLPLGPNGERLSFSGGITTFPIHADAQTDLCQRADEAAYTAKMQGKAASVIYDPAKVSSMNSEERSKQRARDAMLTTATKLVAAVDEKDPYTRNHSELVAIYSATVARAMQLDEATVKLVYRAGLLHDVGKIGIADDILVKGTELSHDEWIQLRMHPEFSYRILEAAEMEPVATWTRHHHEHFDGTGYPAELSGTQIPLASRIILVADAFETMTSDRVYRRALGEQHAVEELKAGAGKQFDPQVVQRMVELIEQGVFVQVMQQFGRIIEVEQPAEPVVDELQPAPAAQAPGTSEAETWAMQQLANAQWAQEGAEQQWTQEQWEAYQAQVAHQQALMQQEAARQQAAQEQGQQPQQGFSPDQWAPPSADERAA